MPALTNSVFAFIAVTLSMSVSYAEGVRKVSFRTLCLERVVGIESVSIPGVNPPDIRKFELYTDVSPLVEGVFKTDEAAFYIEKPPGPDGKPVWELVGKTPMGKSDRQLFVFTPGEVGEGKLPYLVRSFDDDIKSFGMGHVRAINLAPVPIRFILSGDTTPQIPATKYALFPHSKKVNDYDMYPVEVEFLGDNGKWVTGQSVSWKATDLRREIVVTLIDPKYKRPAVRMFTDFPPWMEKSPVPAIP